MTHLTKRGLCVYFGEKKKSETLTTAAAAVVVVECAIREMASLMDDTPDGSWHFPSIESHANW